RNVYLTPTEREEAIQLSRSLDAAANAIERGETNPARIKEMIISYLNQTSGVIDYVEVLSYPALEAIDVVKENIIV
ncbi:pantoate--beta-alanine ligase, partial [Micrococcus sp. SIMBA_131]